MERQEGAQSPYEVYCFNCKSTFAVGTRNCVHCGGRLAASQNPIEVFRTGSTDEGEPTGEVEADESPVVSVARRLSGATLWIVFVLMAMLSRMCEGQ